MESHLMGFHCHEGRTRSVVGHRPAGDTYHFFHISLAKAGLTAPPLTGGAVWGGRRSGIGPCARLLRGEDCACVGDGPPVLALGP